jgi:hypothetical protein
MGSAVRDPILRFAAVSLLCFGGFAPPSLAQQASASGIRPRKGERLVPVVAKITGPARQLAFIENRGQFDANVKFQTRSGGKVLWFTTTGLVFDVARPIATSKAADSHSGTTHGPALEMFQRDSGSESAAPGGKSERLVFSEDFASGSVTPRIEPSAAQPGIYNYFIGNDPKNWRTGVVGYSQLLYHDVWPGIDIRFTVNGQDIEQEFLVHPGADASLISVHYSGVKGLEVAADGSLVVRTLFGPLRESAPRIYSENRGRPTIHGNYKISGDSAYAFQLGSYSKAHPLVIDPTLLFSTYIGGSGADTGKGIAVDGAGNTYIGGATQGGVYPTSTGVFQSVCPSSACSSAVVTKLDPLGRLSYSSYLGSPTGGDNAKGIALDANGEAYLTGIANSGFPTTSNALQNGCDGASFMAKLNSTGTALLYSACLVSDSEAANFNGVGANAIAVDMNGRAYVTGSTSSPFFPTTNGAVQTVLRGGPNAFLSIIDPSLSGTASLVYSTYLGGEVQDYGRSIAVDAYGSAYITGNTFSSHFPVTPNAFQPTDIQANCGQGAGNAQCSTAFVAKVNPNVSGSSGLIYSSYLGGNVGNTGGSASVGDYAYAISVDSSGNAYVAGSTSSLNFPTTPGVFQASSNCGGYPGSGFVTKVNAGGSALVYSTFVSASGQGGGSCSTPISAIALNSSNDAYFAGTTGNNTFPITQGAFQSTFQGGSSDAILAELNSSGSSLIYSSYLGSSGDDSAAGVAVDATGDAYITGNTNSMSFPVTSFAFQPFFGGGTTCGFEGSVEPCPDVFVAKFPIGAPGGPSITGLIPNSGGNSGTVSPQIAGSGFHAGAIAQLNCGSAIVGTNVSVGAGGRLLNTTFDLTAASPGTCSLVVTNPDGTSATLSQALTVQQGGASNIQISLTGVVSVSPPQDQSRFPSSAVLFVTVSNIGNVDYSGGLVSEDVIPGFSLTSLSPAGAAGLPTLVTDSEAAWNLPPLPASASQVFVSTETTMAATGPNISAPAAYLTPISGYTSTAFAAARAAAIPAAPRTSPSLPPVLACLNEITAGCQEATTGLLGCYGGCVFTGPAIVPACTLCLFALWPVYKECVGVNQSAYGNCLHQGATCSSPPTTCLIGDQNCSIIPQVTGQESSNTGAPACVPAPVEVIVASDPNSLQGPAGVGGQDWTAEAQALTYGISFANDTTATAPAQQVVVTQQLGTNVSPSTLTLPGITIPNGASNVQVTVPPGLFNPAAGVNEFTTNVDLRPTQSLLVGVDAKLNPVSQTLTWTFTSIDPTTGLPPLNPLIGFLPPGAGATVSFSVTPKQGVATGSQVTEQATVVFNANPSMSTATWTNTIDNSPPTSQVEPLPTTESCPNFKVAWSGSDVGSGVQGISIFVSDTGAPFVPWLSNTTTTIGTFTGAVGHSYGFYSIAQDLAGNIQAGKTAADATTQVTPAGSCGPPSLSGQVLSSSQSGTTVTVNLQFTNTGLTAAQAVNINQIAFRTLSGSGTVTLAGPALPAALGPLAAGATMTATLTLKVPTAVTRFSLTETGNLLDAASNGYSYSIAQTVIP